MTYDTWENEIRGHFEGDPLWKITAYRKSLFLSDITWTDVSKLCKDARLVGVSDQLYRATGSIGANISEGYSRSSKKDQVRFYEYALGSAREARHWYFQSRHLLGDAVFAHRAELLSEVSRLLLTTIPHQRNLGTSGSP